MIELRSKLPGVLNALRPQGLKRLELTEGGDEGAVVVMAEASPFDRLIALIPTYLRKRKDKETGKLKAGTPYVTMKITLTLIDASEQLPPGMAGKRPSGQQVKRNDKGIPVVDERGNYVFEDAVFQMPEVVLYGAKPKRSRGLSSTQQRSGGLIEPPKPGENKLHMVTFNTAEGSAVQSNATHAERQFASWLGTQSDRRWRRRIRGVEVHISHSPCTLCTVDLKEIAALTPKATKETQTLEWSEVYIDKRRKGADNRSTTVESLGEIDGAGWTVSPASVAPATAAKDDMSLVEVGK